MTVRGITETQQYLTFKLAEAVFALEVSKVREIIDVTAITRIPQAPDFMRGVINLRGSVVPVVDLRLKFGMNRSDQTVNSCIIVVETELSGEITPLGALCDAVQEVLELEPDQIEPAPRMGMHLKADFLKGMGKGAGNFIMILDIDRVFTQEELELVCDAERQAA
jgi:purine-binding chemotaxis protein CheW